MDDLKLPQLIAHRGASLRAPENTLAALYEAKVLGATWVEFDVRLTRDGKAIILHDDTLERTTNGQGVVADLDFSEITDLDAGSWFNSEFRGEPVPTFTQYLQCAIELNLGVNIELKGTAKQAPLLAQCVITELNRYWLDHLPPPLISSSTEACLFTLKQYRSPYLQGYIMREGSEQWRKILQTLACTSLHVEYHALTPERAKIVKATGKKLLAYTIDDVPTAQTLFHMGVDAIFSNDPKLMS